MSTTNGLGFAASAWVRLAVGAVFCAAACAMVWAIERPRPQSAVVVVPPVAGATGTWLVTVESTYAVADGGWAVSVAGRDLPADHHDPYTWSARVAAAAGDELLIVAAPHADDRAPNHGLRIVVGSGQPRLVWSGGEVTATVVLSAGKESGKEPKP